MGEAAGTTVAAGVATVIVEVHVVVTAIIVTGAVEEIDAAAEEIVRRHGEVVGGGVEIEIDGIKLDVCPATGGIWFDRFELDHFDEAHEANEVLLNLPFDPSIALDREARYRSPKAPDVVMMRQHFGVSQEVHIDICPATGGIWVDRGELERIHRLYPTAEERERAARALAMQVMADKIAEQRERREQISALGRVLRWLSPSYHRSSR